MVEIVKKKREAKAKRNEYLKKEHNKEFQRFVTDVGTNPSFGMNLNNSSRNRNPNSVTERE